MQNNAGRILQKSIQWLHKILFLLVGEMCRAHWYWCQKMNQYVLYRFTRVVSDRLIAEVQVHCDDKLKRS
jgi:hypothetical protein